MSIDCQHSQIDVTPASVLRTALALLVAEESNSLDAVLAVTSSGRAASFPGVELVDGPTVLTTTVLISVRPDESL
jgi:non-ribosomal peptide synthetase component F